MTELESSKMIDPLVQFGHGIRKGLCSVHSVLYVLCMYICSVLLCGYVVNTVCMLCGLW